MRGNATGVTIAIWVLPALCSSARTRALKAQPNVSPEWPKSPLFGVGHTDPQIGAEIRMSVSADDAEAARAYLVVNAEDHEALKGLASPAWILVVLAGDPVAFISSAGATGAESPLYYLLAQTSGYVADLSNPDSLYRSRLASIDARKPMAIFGENLPEILKAHPRYRLELDKNYCQKGYDPKPPDTCRGCFCVLNQISE